MRVFSRWTSSSRKACIAAALGVLSWSGAGAAPITTSGSFNSDDQVQFLTVVMHNAGLLSIESIGYAGGLSTTGATVARGGFDTMLFMYDALGSLIAQSDDGLNAQVDPITGLAADAGFSISLDAGTYRLAVTQYDNFALGDLSDGFSRLGEGNFTPTLSGICPADSFCDWSGDARSARWTLNVVGADGVLPEPSTLLLLALPLLALVHAKRRQRRTDRQQAASPVALALRLRRVRWLSLAALLAGGGLAQAATYHVETLRFPPADNTAVMLKVTAPSTALVLRTAVLLNGRNITSALQPDGGTGTLSGTVTGLLPGSNLVQLFNGKAAKTPLMELRIEKIDQTRCNAAALGSDITPALIGEPVSGVSLDTPIWTNASASNPAFCRVNGAMAPVDPAAPPIKFSVVLPDRWAYRGVQLGGGGMNGTIPGLTGGSGGINYLARGWAASGSDSGHNTSDPTWSLNDESMKNLGYMQMKKTHDASWVLQERMYGALPVYSYWVGSSQGGREGFTVAQRYPNDYDAVIVDVPIVNFSSLMLSRALHRIQESPLANWVTSAKVTAISAYVVRMCDALDGINDGINNNYVACRAFFDVNQGTPGRQPWAGLRCPGGVDPNPSNNTVTACLTDGQISTMQFVQTRYLFATPLAFNNPSFGSWVPNTDPAGSGMIVGQRYRGQEGATATAPIYSWLGAPGVVGFLYRDLGANALDYVEGGALNDRRVEISQYLDGTNPDLGPFFARGGKIISTIGTNDSLASPGSQLDYYQSVIEHMGRTAVDASARFFVMPSVGHGLSGNNYNRDGDGNVIPTSAIPNSYDRMTMMIDWREKGIAPPMSPVVTSSARSLPLCSYPTYPRYLGGGLPANMASSYTCATN
jgi:hypothetical protein